MPELRPECIAPPAPPPIPPETPPIPPERGSPPPIPPSGDPPPNFWEDNACFREIFLAYFNGSPEVNLALRIVGRHLFDLVLEWDRWPRPSESSVVEGLRPFVGDLRVMQAYLHDIGAAHRVSSLDAEDARLSRRAESWTRQLGRLAASIEAVLPP